tara:strand:+ start:18 stop:707 length:690 start_codon:yes stop_codon:yes gene_type:complete
MGTLASNRKGYIQGPSESSFTDAYNSSSNGTAYDAQSGNVNNAIQYFQSSGRGGGTFRFTRTFIHFDTSGISGGSSFQLVVSSTAGNASDGNHNVFAVNHNAGSGNGGELANSDFDNVIKGTAWSSGTAWGSSGQITFTLNAAAATQIINNNDFNVALILSSDYNEEEESPLGEDGDISNGIAFGSAINLTYTDPASGFTHKINSLAAASIGKVNTVATANIGKINTVD